MRVVGRSGIVMDLRESVARGLIRSGAVEPVKPAAAPSDEAPAPVAEREPRDYTFPSKPADGPPGYRCDHADCEAVAKSPAGLAAHKRSHKPSDGELTRVRYQQ